MERDPTLAIEYELAREKAGALRRVGGHLEQHLRDLRAAQTNLAAAQPEQRPRIEARVADVWREAERTLWYLIVQREAMGLSRHDDVYATYAIPRGMVPRF